jgi:cbb3-type cytochrome oxidase maturation protein
MSVLYILLPLALVIVAIAVVTFVCAARRGQFDDLETPAMRIVLEDDAGAGPGRFPAHSESSSTSDRCSP